MFDSLTVKDIKLLRYLDSKESRTLKSRTVIADATGIPRGTIYGKLDRYREVGLIDDDGKLTKKGHQAISAFS